MPGVMLLRGGKQNMRRISATFLILILTVLAFSQKSDVSEDDKRTLARLLDVPTATYKFTAQNGMVAFCNLTDVKVTGFRPACVEKNGDEFLIVEEREFEDADIPAARKNRSSCRLSYVNHGGFPYGGECERGKLTVIEVTLANGKTWKLVP